MSKPSGDGWEFRTTAATNSRTGEPAPLRPCACVKCRALLELSRQSPEILERISQAQTLSAADYTPPDPYDDGIAAARAKLAALEASESQFEDSYKAARMAELTTEYADLDAYCAAHPLRPPTLRALSAEEDAAMTPVNTYDAALAALRNKR